MNRAIRTVAGTLAVLAAAALGAVLWQTRLQHHWVYTDADAIREPVTEANAREVLWRPAERLPDVCTPGDDYEPRLTEDGQTMFFVRGRAGANADIWFSTRRREAWSDPRPLTRVNSPADDLGPEPSADGSALYFYSDRPGGLGGYDLWVARRAGDDWAAPQNLGPAVNSFFNDYGPALAPDGAMLYFSSNRPLAGEPEPGDDRWPATIRELDEGRDYDLYASPITERGPGPAVRLDALCTAHNEGTPAVSPFGDFLYFSSDRPGGSGGFDLLRSRRLRGGHEPPENLGPAVNSPFNDLDPAPGMGGFSLTFSSDRPRGDAAKDDHARADYDLYRTFSREVFREGETVRAAIDWAALLPWLWWLLVAALLGLLLWLLWHARESDRFGRLGLLTRCLLASAFVHALILLLLGFWHVGNALDGWLRPAGGTRIAIVRPMGGDDIAAQIRGALTELAVEPMASVASLRVAAPVEPPEPRAEPVEMPVRAVAPALTIERAAAQTTADPSPALPGIVAVEADAPAVPVAVDAPAPARPVAARESTAALRPELLSAAEATPAEIPPVRAGDVRAAIEPSRASAPELRSLNRSPDARDADPAPLPASPRVAAPAPGDVRVALPSAARPVAATEPAPTFMATLPEPAGTRPASPPGTRRAADRVALNPGSFEAPPGALIPTLDPARPAAAAPASPPLIPASAVSLPEPDGADLPVAAPTPAHPAAVAEAAAGVATPAPAPARPARAPGMASSHPRRVTLEPETIETPAPEPIAASAEPADASPAGDVPSMRASGGLSLPAAAPLATPADARRASQTEPATSASLARAGGARPPQRREPARADRPAVALDTPAARVALGAAADPARPVDAPTATLRPIAPERDAGDLPDAVPWQASLGLPRSDAADPASRVAAGEPVDAAAALARSESRARPRDPARPTAPAARLAPAAAGDPVPAPATFAPSPHPAEARPSPGHASSALPDTPALVSDALALRTPSEIAPPTPVTPAPEAGVGDPVGSLSGLVLDAVTGDPLANAVVRLDLPDADPLVARTGPDGAYALRPPALPDHVAVSASRDGYTPDSANFAASDLSPGRRHDFRLQPVERGVIALEADPVVHHLGDNEFEGRINSQFQKPSEGLVYEVAFRLADDQAPPAIVRAEIVLLVKGAQGRNEIHVNGRLLPERLTGSPRDGSFGTFRARVPADWLVAGENTLRIRSVHGDVDFDDFEFVNVRLRVSRRPARSAM